MANLLIDAKINGSKPVVLAYADNSVYVSDGFLNIEDMAIDLAGIDISKPVQVVLTIRAENMPEEMVVKGADSKHE